MGSKATLRLPADCIDLMNSNQQKLAMLEDGDPVGSTTSAGPVPRKGLSVASQASPDWVRQVLRRALTAALPSRLFLTHGPRRGRSVCLTFDDGPDAELTPRLLDVLRDHGIRATFFVIGEKVERHPGIVRRMRREGHCVGSHSFGHSDPKSTSSRRLVDEVHRTAALLRGLLGLEVRLFRPPHGKLTAAKLWRLLWERQTVVLWNVDPKDYTRSNFQVVAAWFVAQPLRGGDLVLLHDTIPYAIDLVPILADQARASGLTFATVADWLPRATSEE
jgi:peptidoglycan-N-acetylglucosamine deacetylase